MKEDIHALSKSAVQETKSKQTKGEMNYVKVALIACIISCLRFSATQAQVLTVFDGYRDWLQHFVDSSGVRTKKMIHLSEFNTLVNVATSQRRIEMIIPLLTLQNSDTIVVFAYASKLRKHFRRKPINFFSPNFPEGVGFERTHLAKITAVKANLDSVYRHIYSNPMINSDKFSFSEIDGGESNRCCRASGNFSGTLSLIYGYFRQGILLYLNTYTGELHYAAF